MIFALVQLSGYGVSLFLANVIVNQFRDEEDKFTITELLVTVIITCVLFGLYLAAATQIDVLRYLSRVAFYVIFYAVFRPDSFIEGIGIIVLSLPIFFVISYSLMKLFV